LIVLHPPLWLKDRLYFRKFPPYIKHDEMMLCAGGAKRTRAEIVERHKSDFFVLSSLQIIYLNNPIILFKFQIRMESRGGKQSSIMFCTNGVLLRLLVSRGTNAATGEVATRALKDGILGITHIVLV